MTDENKIDIQQNIAMLENRVAFLRKWISDIRSAVTFEGNFEAQDKVFKLESEIAVKEGLIYSFTKDIEQMDKQRQQFENEVKSNYVMFVEELKKALPKVTDQKMQAMIRGCISRSNNKTLSMEEMTKDYKLMKSMVQVFVQQQQREETPMKKV